MPRIGAIRGFEAMGSQSSLTAGELTHSPGDGLLPPVLKHGPRSLPNGRTFECQTRLGGMKVVFTREPREASPLLGATGHGPDGFSQGSEVKSISWDPKDCELFLGRWKAGETLLDDRTQC